LEDLKMTTTTTEIKIWVGNLGKYNEGCLTGEWFTLPEDVNVIMEKIGVAPGTEYEEYYIADSEAPFEIGTFASIEKLNEMAEVMEQMTEEEIEVATFLIDNYHAQDMEDAYDLINGGNIMYYYDCHTMEEVAEQYLEETGMLSEIPENLAYYFNYEQYGRDMEIEGSFYDASFGIFQVMN
jgi:hypothetical protein